MKTLLFVVLISLFSCNSYEKIIGNSIDNVGDKCLYEKVSGVYRGLEEGSYSRVSLSYTQIVPVC